VDNSVFDLFVVVLAGFAGYLFKKIDFDIAPMIVAIILGPMLENNLRSSLYLRLGDPFVFIKRPISAMFIILLLIIMIAPPLWRIVSAKRASKTS
jgi:putative tricarboxylic transport membrane protein